MNNKNNSKSFMSYLRNKKIIATITVVLVLASAYYFHFNKNENIGKYDTIVASSGELIKAINATGKIKPAHSVSLAFEGGGRLVSVPVSSGDKVYKGMALAYIESGKEMAQVSQAKADLLTEKIVLQELKRGAKKEDIYVLETEVSNKKLSIKEAQKNLRDKIQDAFVSSDNAIRNNTDQLFSSPKSANPVLNIPILDSQLRNDIISKRLLLEKMLKDWEIIVRNLKIDDTLTEKSSEAHKNLFNTKIYLDNIALAVNALVVNSSLSQATIDGYKSDVSIARNSINTAIVNISSAESKLTNTLSALLLAESKLALKKAPATIEDILAQKARIDSKQAVLDTYNVALLRTVLRAPFNGIVTKQDAKVGAVANAGENIVSLISNTKFEVEVFIPEADIAGIKVGEIATFTLDAYRGELVFNAVVTRIDPAETIIDSVPTYKVILSVNKNDDRIKPGMTANLDILVKKIDDVIAIPARSIKTQGSKKYVRVLDNNQAKDREVEIGMRGSDGRVEIKKGIKNGDKVIVFEKK